ncbi:hypothetical protein NW133_05630 [Staphylococcus pettenkoferi]|uniref:5,10-methylene-tetrahydrofolate dehydrogenase n=2 Tax=Staphylococcus pettenkoferi TaxID=170573 RepID=A0ABT4BK13_9STAP|nr:hypothetical protein [Staphylococcus pettenkoferi]MCY1564621.1 hypothetical protein [Staphylococcus pettenkoferi]MCY1583008.1 hypothetical protein [Staphylococcus pettenkoferi]MCY1590467.1 hypothetical protein [Staphylococcus pettenkoferi]MCY1592117.1 hypothetical protein [Staphylococcus pettenkoferi]MCY1600064.1 hypothetical protein [Staphylococcus pettenkoferi]
MNQMTIGLIPSPDMPNKITDKIKDTLAEDFSKVIDDQIDWDIETHVASMVGTAEHMDKTMDIISNMKKQKEWDIAICITDLPSISDNKVVLSDIHTEKKTALLSLPALGMWNVKNKLRHFLTYLVHYIMKPGEEAQLISKKHFRFSKIDEVQPDEDSDQKETRLILKSVVSGWSHLISGMTLANEPWTAIFDFKKIISVSFATGAYITIFSTPWDMTLYYNYWRFILLMILSIVGMTVWLIYAYQLWETPSPSTQRLYRYVYNLTTFMTLGSITVFNFIALFILLTLSTMLFVPPWLYTHMTSLKSLPSLLDYFNLIWFMTCISILAGALGSTVENAEKIKRVTYSYRQYYRYEQLEKEREEEETEGESYNDQENYEGKKQSHSEEGSSQ